jgi:hypothetical protein
MDPLCLWLFGNNHNPSLDYSCILAQILRTKSCLSLSQTYMCQKFFEPDHIYLFGVLARRHNFFGKNHSRLSDIFKASSIIYAKSYLSLCPFVHYRTLLRWNLVSLSIIVAWYNFFGKYICFFVVLGWCYNFFRLRHMYLFVIPAWPHHMKHKAVLSQVSCSICVLPCIVQIKGG